MPTHTVAKSWMDNGVMFALSLLVVWALALLVWLAARWAKARIDRSTKEKPCDGCQFIQGMHEPKLLLKHRMFATIRLARASLIPSLPIRERGRQLVFTDLLEIKFRVVADKAKEWLDRRKDMLVDLDADVLAGDLLILLADMIETYEAEAMREGIHEVVIQKFNEWHDPRVRRLKTEVQMICESAWLGSNVNRVGLVFSHIEQVLQMTVVEAERTLHSLNGSLTGKVYKGVVIGPCYPSSVPQSAQVIQ